MPKWMALVVVSCIGLRAGGATAEAARCKPLRGKAAVSIKQDATVADWVRMLEPVVCRAVRVPDALATVEVGGMSESKGLTGAQLWDRFRKVLRARGLKVAQRGGLWRVSGVPITSAAAPASPGIRKLTATSYEIDRVLVDSVLADPTSLAAGVDIALVIDDEGNGAGYELTQVSAGSLLARLGLSRGDVVESVNGKAIRGPGDAMQAVQSLSTGSRFTLGVSRYGSARTMSYQIR